jgi:lysophospholipase L1-like esterase
MNSGVHTKPAAQRKRLRYAIYVLQPLYWIAILLVFDFIYSSLQSDDRRSPRVADPIYHHGFVADFDGFDAWGESRYRLMTNSLGFKDAAARDVPPKGASRRVLLIGDSFTEGIGLAFEDTFAGMLWQAGQAKRPQVEFLNAGVASYSPVIYYRKIKQLLEQGLQLDSVVVFSDMSDVFDEASKYFCVDADEAYRRLCTGTDRFVRPRSDDFGAWLQRKFIVTDALRILVKFKLGLMFGHAHADILEPQDLDGWALPGWNEARFQPLGIEGGVTRSLRNMGRLAELLKRRGIPLTIVVYPYPAQLQHGVRDNRQIRIWKEFCAVHCTQFIDLFPAFFALKEADKDWYKRYFIYRDIHFNRDGNRVIADAIVDRLM